MMTGSIDDLIMIRFAVKIKRSSQFRFLVFSLLKYIMHISTIFHTHRHPNLPFMPFATTTTTTKSTHTSSTDYLNPQITSMSPSSLLLGRAKEEELQQLYKDHSNYRKNSKAFVLFWINFTLMLVSPHNELPLMCLKCICFSY